ncbi:MAG: class I SAM-dependent RNA methyltransferase [Thermoanaerobaculia bacterium]
MKNLPPIQPGAVMEVVPEALVAGGDALARIEGFPVFLPGGYPGDRLRVRITEVKKGFGRGTVEEIVSASSERREAPCPVARECGGCDWTELRLDRQLYWKKNILGDTLRRIGKFDVAALPAIAVTPSPLTYRLRSRLHVSRGAEALPGFFERRSHQVVPLPEECEIVGPEVLGHLGELREAAGQIPGGAMETFENGPELTVSLTPDGSDARSGGETRIRVAGSEFLLDVRSFFQVNRHLLGELQRRVMEIAAGTAQRELAWDLYGGVGFFAVPLATRFESVLTVETSRDSSRWAALNAAGTGKVQAITEDVEQFLRRRSTRPDFVLVDPPRAGLSPAVGDALAGSDAEIICYLSCDPVTFSRDANRLARRGWTLTSIRLIDLFPNTHHIETLSSFVRER